MADQGWSMEFQAKASVYALNEHTKQWQERGTTGQLQMYRSTQYQNNVQVKWFKSEKEIWWRLMAGKLKPKGERAWVLKAIAVENSLQEILAIRFGNEKSSSIFYTKYSEMFPQFTENEQYNIQNDEQQQQGYYDDQGNYIYYDQNGNPQYAGYYDENGNYIYTNQNNEEQYYQEPQQQQQQTQQQQQIMQQQKPKKLSKKINKKKISISKKNAVNGVDNGKVIIDDSKPWECAVCTYENQATTNACGMCGLAKKASAKQQNSKIDYNGDDSEIPATPAEWQCNKCTLKNAANKKKCTMCGAKRISFSVANNNIQSPVYNQIPKYKQKKVIPNYVNKWKCSICTLENEATVLRCEACNTAKNADGIGAAYEDASEVDQYDDYQQVLNARNNKINNIPNSKQKGYWNAKTSKQFISESTKTFKEQNKNQKPKPTMDDFRRAASDISCYNDINPSGVFSTLRSVSKKLLKDDVRYRTLDTTNPKVMERLIGYEGVIDFLMLLGFEADAIGMKLICHNKPAPEVVRNAIDVLNGYEKRLGLGRNNKKTNDNNVDVNGNTPGGQIINGDGNNGGDKDDEQDTLTLEQIIMWSTHETMRDAETMETLIMTHKSFTDSITLLKQLKKRFFLPMPVDIKNDKQKIIEWRSKTQRNIDLKVINSLKHWMKQFWYQDFYNNKSLIKELKLFIKQMESETTIETKWMGVLSKALNDELDRYIKNSIDYKENEKKEEDQINEKFNQAQKNKPKRFRIENLNPEELSDQITLMDFNLFRKIEPRECLGQAWKKKGNTKNAPNILAMIRQFNNLTVYIQISILKERSLKERGKTMRRIIKIGERFREQKNYNSLCAVFSALNSAPIHRLKLAWKRVPEKHIQMFENFKVIFKRDFNHRNLRQLFRKAPAPCIPHIGLFLQDLVFIDDGNASHRENANFAQHGKMVNFSKSVRLFDRIKNIKLYQNHAYTNIKENIMVQKLLMDEFDRLKDVTEDQIWDMSTEIKKNDEKDAKKWGK